MTPDQQMLVLRLAELIAENPAAHNPAASR